MAAIDTIYDINQYERVKAATNQGVNAVNSALDGIVSQAMPAGWGQEQLGAYNAGTNANAQALLDPNSAQGWLNPQMDLMLNKAGQAVQGSAGAGLQSSATNNAVADRVAGMSGDMWQSALNNSNNAQKMTSDIYQQQFENNMLPDLTRSQMIADVGMAKANALGSMYSAQAAQAGQNRGLLSGLGL